MLLGTYIIGIDVGNITTYASVLKDGAVVSIPTISGRVGFPTLVVFDDSQVLVGEAAAAYSGKEDMIFSFKNMYLDSSVTQEFKLPIQANFHTNLLGEARRFKACEVMATILAQVKQDAERFLGERIRGAVIAVPNHFNSEQRKAMIKAAFIANLPVEQLISDTSALMISKGVESDGSHVVVDFGSNSFQVAVISREKGVIQVIESDSCKVGGQNFTKNIVNYFASIFKENYGIDVLSDDAASVKLKNVCEKAKRRLDTFSEALIEANLFGRQVKHRITLEEFETISQYELLKIFLLCSKAVENPHLGECNGLILAGKSTRIFKFREVMQTNIFPNVIFAQDWSVAHGAAQLFVTNVKEVSHYNFYVMSEIDYFVPLIFKGVNIPTFKTRSFCIPNHRPAHNISIYSEDLLLDSYKVTKDPITSTLNMCFILGIDSNGILSVNHYADAPLIMNRLELDTNNEFELVDINSKGLTIAKPQNQIHALNAFKLFVQGIRSLINKAHQDNLDCSELLIIHTTAIDWLESNAQEPELEIQLRLKETNSKVKLATSKLQFK